ncbi:MAG: hypothetical protein JWO78_1393 [Micavibrio sp.]|nr:hypothetical protein [Micavibrio sp.]
MAGSFILKRLAHLCAVTLLILGGVGRICPAYAQAIAQFSSDTQPKMMDLGDDFMRDIGGALKRSDLYLSGAGKFELAEQKSGSFVPDGEPLLLHAQIGKSFVNGRQDIYTIKDKSRLMISLADFALALDLPIKVNPKAGTATGWFVRETQTFSFDLNKREVAIAAKTTRVRADEARQEGGDLLVSAEALEKWLNLSFEYDLAALNLNIITAEPYPIELAYLRTQKPPRRGAGDSGAKLPKLPPEYGYASIPYVDTELSLNMYQSPGSRRTHDETWSTIITGDYAGFNTSAYLGGTDIKPFLNTARITMGKDDPYSNLLGPLNATAYRFGDVTSVSGSMIGNSSQERGVFVTNKGVTQDTTKTYTEINGDSHPGWDVELYRNESYIDFRRVGTDGRYDFGKVDLFAGSNDFKLLFYSPQGERSEEHRLVNVDSGALLKGGIGRYSASLTEKGKSVYSRTPQKGESIPHFGATYDFGVNGLGTVSTAISGNDDGGQYRTFLETDLATAFLDTFFNASLAYDNTSSAFGGQLRARRNFGKQSANIGYSYNSPKFNPGSATAGASNRDSYTASFGGPLFQELYILKNSTYNLGTSYSENYDGSTGTQSGVSFTTRVSSVVFNAGIQYNTTTSPGNPLNGTPASSSDSSSANFGLRGGMFGGSWRLGAQYQVLPKKEFQGAEAEYTRTIAENLDSTTSVSYEPQSRLTTGKIGLNWITSKAVISPSVQYDTNKNVVASVSAHFGLAADPSLSNIRMSGEYFTGSGGVSARIFQDANGNGIFDDGDRLLQDANVIAIQGQQSATSGENGIAFIANLPKNILTDITVDAGGSESAYGISLFKGVAVLPHPGGVTKLDFPIVESGEIDGQAEFAAETGSSTPARGLTVSLIAPDGKVQKFANAESDGYWSISMVEPGTYYMTANGDAADPGYFIPRMMEFKPDGSTYFGQGVKLTRGYNTQFNFSADNAAPDGANHARVIRPSDIASQKFQMQVGSFHSRLAMTIAWYKMKLHSGSIPGGLELAMPMAGMPEDSTGVSVLVIKSAGVTSMEQGAAACQAIGEMNVGACSVNVITTYRTPGEEKIIPYSRPPVAVAAKPAGKEDTQPQPVAVATAFEPDVIVRPTRSQPETTATVSPALAADLADYVAANPALDKAALRQKTVLLNLGSYNSRALMSVIWYKVKTRYTTMIGDATLLIRPTDSNASSQTGKYTLRVSLPVFDIDDANNRCHQLMAQGQFCTVEVLPSGLQASR